MSTSLQAGAATANITPWLGIEVPGSHRTRYAEGVDDELLAKALVIDNGDMRIALITCDLIVMPQGMADRAKERIAARCDIPPENVMINATHTHTAAGVADLLGTGEDKAYVEWAPLKMADAVEVATHRMQAARIGFATAHEDRISFNRRWHMRDGTVRMNPGAGNPDLVKPTYPKDPEVTMLYVEGADGRPIAAVSNFVLHYVGTDNGLAISADYFGHFHRLIQRYLDPQCVGMVWNGTSGDINNNDYSGKIRWTASGHKQAIKMANVLAGHLITEIQLMEMQDELVLGAAVGTFDFERKDITDEDLAMAEKILAVPAGTYTGYDSGPFSWVVGQTLPHGLSDVYAVECQRLAQMPLSHSAPVQALRLGDASIVALPGEIFVEFGLNIKQQSPASPQFVVSLANGYIGYVCTDKALTEHGGYETWAGYSSLGGVGTGPAMEKCALELLSQLF
ncbi:MAG: hypothetical protein OXM03_07885 [Chloroflexota bacterium]|nr:hypothetical protein [Chloroflexota bacterium]MDE2840534.1 hypothetical protein [Chloroflexota bacterium]MDE2930391.1 hypothetical protein [Chloroflexota bacterium]